MSRDLFPGIGVAGYRSYGEDPQYLAPLARINVLVGPNNVGKSSALRLFTSLIPSLYKAVVDKGVIEAYSADDVRNIRGKEAVTFRLRWPVNVTKLSQYPKELHGLFDDDKFEGPSALYSTESPRGGLLVPDPTWMNQMKEKLNPGIWSQISTSMTGTSGGGDGEDFKRVMSLILNGAILGPPSPIIEIPAHRQMKTDDNTSWTYDGIGFIQQLSKMKNPEATEHLLREQYDSLISTVQSVLELENFSYHVASSGTLVLEVDGERRPLASVGTGYEHIILLIAATVLQPDALLCVEEPEVHLHPRLQRRLAEYLRDSTSNQMIISTHSATMIDALQGSTFQLSIEEGDTKISIPLGGDLVTTLDQLGYRASDLLQTNCAIWVEGPSDRIYLNWWIQSLDPTLVDGVHYTIMYYGGSLLSSITTEGQPLDVDMVPLRSLHQHFIVVCDSDRSSPASPLKERVMRIEKEASSYAHGIVWITGGRTIENYLLFDVVEAAARKIHPSITTMTKPISDWDSALVAMNKDSKPVEIDKVLLAREIAMGTPNLEVLDLKKNVVSLIDFIKESNS